MLISYERAKAEGLGYDARGGLMERAERMVLLGIGLAFDVLIPVLWIMVGLMADEFTQIMSLARQYEMQVKIMKTAEENSASSAQLLQMS
jgi:hypothetical protein